MLDTAIYSRLLATVGTSVGNRITPTAPTENSLLPAITYTLSSTEPVWSLQGGTGTQQATVTLDTYAIDFATVFAIAGAIRTALDGWHTSSIRGVFLDTARSVPMEFGYHYTQTFRIIGA